MKKFTLVLAAILLSATFVFAQREAKPGILPEKGDFAIGVDAAPFLDFGGNLFSDNGSHSPWFDGLEGEMPGTFSPKIVLFGKYFLEDNKAVRAKLRFNLGNYTYKAMVTDDNDPDKQVTDKASNFYTDIELGLGMEYRRGYGRLQAFWGYEASIGVASNSYKFTYANPMNADNPDPYYHNWSSAPDGRYTKMNEGTAFMLRPAVFAGVEYFFAKKMSIGAEFNAGLVLYTKGKGKETFEYMDGSDKKTKTDDYRNPYDTASDVGLFTNATGSLYLMFHF